MKHELTENQLSIKAEKCANKRYPSGDNESPTWLGYYHGFIDGYKSAIKALEADQHTKECEHPFQDVYSRCGGEINTCYKCGKTF